MNNTIRSRQGKQTKRKKRERRKLIYKIRYRIGLLAALIGGQRTSPPYNLEEFTQNPGVYFERIGRMHPVQTWWKLVIRINISSLIKRAEQKGVFSAQNHYPGKNGSCMIEHDYM